MKKLLIWAMVLSGILLGACTNDEDTKNEPGSIYGIVTELGTAEPMKAVGVELYKAGDLLLKTVTFDDGHFEFSDLNSGSYRVKVVADGYEQTEEGNVTVEAGRQARIDLQVVKPDPKMVVNTYNIENINSRGAMFRGVVTWQVFDSYPSEYGFVYSKEINALNGTNVISLDKIKGINISQWEFTATVNSLSSGTYYVKAYAKNPIGTVYGAVREFVISGYPAVSTLAASNISETAATLNGHIDYVGDPAYTERGFVYSSSFANPTVDDAESATTKVLVSGSGEDFSVNVAGLTKNKTYYVRAYVSNNKGTWYGESVSFNTPDHSQYVIIESIAIQKQDLGSANWSTANSMCKASRVGGFSDWRLPTIAELALIYTHRTELSGFKAGKYWSSTYDNTYYCYVDFSSGTQSSAGPSSNQFYVRAVRTVK